jgi:uncharacterized Zn-finger protein
MMTHPPVQVAIGEYQITFSQREIMCVTLSLQIRSHFLHPALKTWKTVYTQEKCFGSNSFNSCGYCMSEIADSQFDIDGTAAAVIKAFETHGKQAMPDF